MTKVTTILNYINIGHDILAPQKPRTNGNMVAFIIFIHVCILKKHQLRLHINTSAKHVFNFKSQPKYLNKALFLIGQV